MEMTEIKGIIEALLFVSSDYLSVEKMADIIEVDTYYVEDALKDLLAHYESINLGLTIKKSDAGYKLFTKPEFAPYIKRLLYPRSRHGLSQAALETLSIVAVKQPVTKAHIEEIRGVKSDGAVSSLLDKNLIEEVGRLEIPGKPAIFATTKLFLEYFGLKSPDELRELLLREKNARFESEELQEIPLSEFIAEAEEKEGSH